jgi:uncharacterized membrane protein
VARVPDIADEGAAPVAPEEALAPSPLLGWRTALRRWSDLSSLSPAAAVVAAAMLFYTALFGTLTWRQQTNFGVFGFDMGIYDQSVWLLSRGHVPFNTIRGINYFGHHVNLITILFVPFYWLGAGPHFLLLLQTVVLAAGAIPIYLLGRDRLAEPIAGAAIAVAYLLHPTLQWINWWNFHPDAFMITPLLCCWLFASRRQWRLFAVCALIALSCKEDAAPAVLVLGLLVAVLWKRWVGLATAAVAGVWFLLVTQVVIPRANGGIGPFYNDMFPTLGNSAGEIVRNSTFHPSRLVHLLTEHRRLAYYSRLLAPVGFVALLGLPVLLIAGPQTVINATSNQGYTFDSRFHYSAIALVAIFLAVIEGCAFFGRRRPLVQGVLVGLVIASATVANVTWSPSPLSKEYRSGIWARPNPKNAARHEAMAMIPPSEGVSATYDLVTHLEHRTHIYEFPNPWVLQNWGIRGERPPDVGTVDWLLLDQPVPPRLEPVMNYLTTVSGEFQIVLRRDGVLLAKRVAPPTLQQLELPPDTPPEEPPTAPGLPAP